VSKDLNDSSKTITELVERSNC